MIDPLRYEDAATQVTVTLPDGTQIEGWMNAREYAVHTNQTIRGAASPLTCAEERARRTHDDSPCLTEGCPERRQGSYRGRCMTCQLASYRQSWLDACEKRGVAYTGQAIFIDDRFIPDVSCLMNEFETMHFDGADFDSFTEIWVAEGQWPNHFSLWDFLEDLFPDENSPPYDEFKEVDDVVNSWLKERYDPENPVSYTHSGTPVLLESLRPYWDETVKDAEEADSQ